MMCPVCGATVFRIVWQVSRRLTERKTLPISPPFHFSPLFILFNVPSQLKSTQLKSFLPDGSATCTQATGGGSSSSREGISSTGTTGRPPHRRSSLSGVCATCSGTRGAVSLPPTRLRLLAPDPAPAPNPTPPRHLPPLPPRLEPAEQDPHTSASSSHSPPPPPRCRQCLPSTLT